jgi:DNA-binding IclR family transcriptional regulator
MSNTSYDVPSIDRAIDIIEYMADNEEGISQRELATRLGYPQNSVFRILKTLESRNLVSKISGTSKYVLTPKICILGSRVANRFRLLDVAQPIMGDLTRKTRETVQLFVPHSGKSLLLEQVETSEPIKIAGQIGCLYDLHCSAPGKVILAYMPDDEVQSIIDTQGLSQRTHKTISNILALRSELNNIRTQGYALDDQEYGIGIRCAAAPVYNYQGSVVAALSISGPMSRVDDTNLDSLAHYVVDAANSISSGLGYTGSSKKPLHADAKSRR